MNMLMKAKVYGVLFALFTLALLSACDSSASIAPTPSGTAGNTSSPASGSPSPPATLPANRVELVYFHMPQRCGTCLCFEERISFVVNTYFQNELRSGKLAFTVCELGDRKKAALIRRYDAFTTQFFINTVKNDVDNSKYIEEIWSWHCVGDKEGFAEKMRNLIEQGLKDVG